MTSNTSSPGNAPDCTRDPTQATTFPQLLRGAAASYGDAPAIIYRDASIPDEVLSFVDLERQSATLARGLIARGVGKGSRIGFMFGNGPGFALWFAAIARIGAIAIPISTTVRANELVRILRQSDVAGVVVQRALRGKDLVDIVVDALHGLPGNGQPPLLINATPFLRWIVTTGDDLPAVIHPETWLSDSAVAVSEELLAQVESEISPADQIMEIYTSGSTALPKGVKHNHGPIMFRTHYLRSMTPASVFGAEIIAPLPMFWVGGLMMYLLPNLESGATTVCMDQLLNNSQFAMGSVLADEDLAIMRPADMATIWGLGMTETAGPYSYGDVLRVPGYPLCAPMDHLADRFEVRIADENDEEVPDGTIGEIQVRGYALSPGLHKIEREHYFTPDGYFHTGDQGFRQDGRILFTGRVSDMIKTASANVSPAEVELEMQQLDGVHSAYVVGLPDKQRGQLVAAAVVPSAGAALDFVEIEATLRKRLSAYKVPRKYIALAREEVPMLDSNKVHRRQLEKLLGERLGASSEG